MPFSHRTGAIYPMKPNEEVKPIVRPGFISQKMRIVFMGTPDFAGRILQIMLSSLSFAEVVAVYSRPDAVSKRGSATVPSAVSAITMENDLPLFRPETLRDKEVQQQLRDLQPDIIVVAAYGMILPPAVLNIPPHGCINVHASLLPRWRGAAPIERAILVGDARTGVCIMRMEEGLDTGPYRAYASTDVGEKTAAELHVELADMGGHLLVENLPALLGGSSRWTAQNEDEVTYAHKIEKHELQLSPDLTIVDFLRRVRASSESAPAKFKIENNGVTVLEATLMPPCGRDSDGGSSARSAIKGHRIDVDIRYEDCAEDPLSESPFSANPGTIRLIKHQGKRHVIVGCSDGSVELLQVKPDSKKAMAAADWINGFPEAKKGLSWA